MRTPDADYALALQAEPLATTFTCLFCNHEKSIAVKLNKKSGVGDLECKVCGQKFQCGINCAPPPRHTPKEAVTREHGVG